MDTVYAFYLFTISKIFALSIKKFCFVRALLTFGWYAEFRPVKTVLF
jgi:hypothetical protein